MDVTRRKGSGPFFKTITIKIRKTVGDTPSFVYPGMSRVPYRKKLVSNLDGKTTFENGERKLKIQKI